MVDKASGKLRRFIKDIEKIRKLEDHSTGLRRRKSVRIGKKIKRNFRSLDINDDFSRV